MYLKIYFLLKTTFLVVSLPIPLPGMPSSDLLDLSNASPLRAHAKSSLYEDTCQGCSW